MDTKGNTMIPLDITNPVVLRRTLEEMEASIINLDAPITPIEPLDTAADLATVLDKVNDLIVSYNTLIANLQNNYDLRLN